MKIGYCCINSELSEKGITTNRSMDKSTFESKGIEYASKLALKNVEDLLPIFHWNERNGVKLFRISSDLFPWMSQYELEDLPDYYTICLILGRRGDDLKASGTRVTMHPGPFTVLGSENPEVVKKSIKELNQHAQILDLMGLEQSHEYPINIHVNTTTPSKEEAMKRFCENFKLLSESAKKRLTVENDDKSGQYDVEDLIQVHYGTGVPIVFDFHHFNCGPRHHWQNRVTELYSQEHLEQMKYHLTLALDTWNNSEAVRNGWQKPASAPICHISSTRLFEEKGVKPQAHADYIYDPILTFGYNFDIEIEAKAKEKALLRVMESDCFTHRLNPLTYSTIEYRIAIEKGNEEIKYFFSGEGHTKLSVQMTTSTLSVRKGDRVKFKYSFPEMAHPDEIELVGEIFKYPSNKEITVWKVEGLGGSKLSQCIISKDQITEKIC